MYHGYYYHRPYNYRHVFEDSQLALQLGGDPRAPYATKMFERVYEEFGRSGYNDREDQSLHVLANRSKKLPDLQKMLSK
jgi:hypothetical protein